jgi:hypothetical protein
MPVKANDIRRMTVNESASGAGSNPWPRHAARKAPSISPTGSANVARRTSRNNPESTCGIADFDSEC